MPVIVAAAAVYLTSVHLQSREVREVKHDKSLGKKSLSLKQDLLDSVKILLTGLPEPGRLRLANFLTLGGNVVLVVMSMDLLLRSQILYTGQDLRLTRVGYVSPTTAKILVREPDVGQLPLTFSYREQESASDLGTQIWTTAGTVYKLSEDVDFTHSIPLEGLRPSTHYEYKFSNNETGAFVTAPAPGSTASNTLTFLTSSCIKPNFPYTPFSHSLAIHGFDYLASTISELAAKSRLPSFMLFLGDFIYIDVPYRFSSTYQHYRSEYRRVYSSPSWETRIPSDSAYTPASIPWLHILDDHEIANDWAQGNTTAPFPAANDPYQLYHVSVNPPIPEPAHAPAKNTTYFTFTEGPASFFMVDTRTYRSLPDQDNSTILGNAQLSSLLSWISTPPSPPSSNTTPLKFKIISSSVPFTKAWQVGTSDTWGGFLTERRIVFEAIWAAEKRFGIRFVLLSGDRHEFGAARFLEITASSDEVYAGDEDGAGPGIHEFSVGPLSMFYLPLRTFKHTDREDIPVKYVPDGNSKFGVITVKNGVADGAALADDDLEKHDNARAGAQIPVGDDVANGIALKSANTATLTYTLVVDGISVWEYEIAAPAECGLSGGETVACLHEGSQRVVFDRTGREGSGVYGGLAGLFK